VNLEDLAQPKGFGILDTLRQKAEIPVWHDDQQGTATVTLAGLTNALKVVGKKFDEVRITFVGSRAANVACTRLIFGWGADPGRCLMVDSKGILGKHRQDLKLRKAEFVDKWRLCQITNAEGQEGGIPEAIEGADVVVALSKPGPGTILPEWVAKMREDAVGFPGIFRGALDVWAETITDEICFAAAQALADQIGSQLNEERILPNMDDWEVFPREAAAVGIKAREQGVARLQMSYDDLLNRARTIITRSRELTRTMMRDGFIAEPPK
jgi:malate dehydrogenase (oxaloacetate-decarboxylating)